MAFYWLFFELFLCHESVSISLNDSEPAGELDEAEEEMVVLFPAGNQASAVLQPTDGPLTAVLCYAQGVNGWVSG